MQVVEQAYSNFVNSINSDQTRHIYEYTLSQFLKHYQIDLDTFLSLPQQEMLELKSKLLNHTNKSYIIRKYCGGNCSYCGEIPIKKISYNIGDDVCSDAKKVEWYCSNCFQKWVASK